MKKCPRCSYENPDDAEFCEKCHYPLFEIRSLSINEIAENKERLKNIVFYYLLFTSIFYIVSIVGFSIFPQYMSIINAIATIFLSLAIYESKVKWYYYFANLSPLGLFLIPKQPLVGYLIFSFSGVIISDYIRVIYNIEKDEIFRISFLILIIGYLGGLLFAILYNMIIAGYLVTLMESVRRIMEKEKAKK
ncbi:zinc-ribbon domain-containing protein [Sulfolobus sp. S-194]|uniref:zinc ribbon domain-containing protein n=1 Tax=Sulfolobus sp. S-194 TaxID=2512240 RepID=UPI001437221E|nr:zinc-ribbon domain-containing protein [Sulfolobus sp. S-194]QIW24583.1 zinc-ribbon domain-containing protein [Sulfolobus sp. S-194]